MEKVEHKKDRKKKYNLSVISIVIVLLFATFGIVVFLKFYNFYIDETLYAERLSQMKDVTTQLFAGLEDVVTNKWELATDSCRKVQNEEPKSLKNFLDFMEKQAYLEDFESKDLQFVAIDEVGRYYTQTGKKGLLGERNYFASSPDQISFVSNSMISDESRMFFLKKLEEPIVLGHDEDVAEITYFGISQGMEQLNPYFNCKAYEGNNSVYVVDTEGLKLFSNNGNGSEELLKGFNIYNTLGSMSYLHGSSFESARKELDVQGMSYSNAILNDREIYYSLYQMENAAWTLVFLVPSEYVAINTVKLVNVTIRLVMIFAVSLVIVSVVAIFLLMRNQQKSALAVEKRNNEALAGMNKELKKAAEIAEEATKKAEAASKAKTDFLANMSHDIRTPMNAIVGITSLMEHEAGVSDKMETYIQKVQLSSRHLLGLINDILDMSRIESKEVKLNVEHVSLAEQLGQIDSIIRAQTNEHHQNFHIHVNEIAHEYLIGDGVRLRQIILNLLSNAIKYTPNGGDITLDFVEVPCDASGYAKYICAVTDTGYGMTEEFLKHIFEPFTRAENSVTNKVQGTGLGMAITKNIVDLMGGEIKVSSEIGRGSRFEVTITLKIDSDKTNILDGDRILLVSDENQLVKNMKAALSEISVEFCYVSTEEEAIGWLKEEVADIILISGCLQNKTLTETVELLRKSAENAMLIFCVDYIQDERVQERIADSGVDGIVLRPFFVSNLETAIARTRTHVSAEEENTSILKGMSFLCAEDNELNAEILKEILDMYGASCTVCEDGEKIVEAFKKVKPEDYDAILMDVQMPNMNGLEATRAIRNGENPVGKTIPIIAMTANAFSEDVQHCIGAGMDAHIAKPLDVAVLEKTLRRFSIGGGQTKSKKY